MNKSQLVGRMAEDAGITKKSAAAALGALVKAIHETLKQKEGTIRIADLGTFRVMKTKARTGVNPRTQEKIKIPSQRVPRFSASKALRESVKKAK